MKAFGVLLAVLGIAVFVLPLLDVQIQAINQLGEFRPFAAVILVLIGGGIVLFSND